MRARTLVFALLLLAPGLALLPPPAGAASTAPVTSLGISDSAGVAGLVGHSAVHYKGATYVFGGRLSDNSYSDKVYKLDHATNRTTEVATLPAVLPSNSGGRYSGAAVLLGDRIYYMGGAVLVMVDINNDGTPDPVPQSSADVFEFDPATNTLRVYAEKLPRTAWGLGATAVSGSRAYVFGGFTFSVDPQRGVDASRRDWVVEFEPGRSPSTDSACLSATTCPKFKELTTVLPFPVQDPAVAHMGDYVYVIGGLGNNHNVTNPCATYQDEDGNTQRYPLCQSKSIVPFHLTSRTVRPDQIKEMPYRAQFIGAAVVRGKAYVPGGLLADGTPSSTIFEFDPASRTPVRVLPPTLPRGAFGAPVVTDGTAVFMLGGRIGGERQLTDEVVRIDVQPSAPWSPRAAAATAREGGMRISWEPPAYDGDSPVSLYRVYRSTPDEAERLLKETNTLAVDDMTVKPGGTYFYRITALNAIGESPGGARLTVTAGVTPPGPVEGFQAYAGDREAVLRWGAPEELGGANLSGYRVIRDGRVLATLPPGRHDYRDTNLENGVAYAYQVRAYNSKGDGAPSPTLRVSPAAVPPSPGPVTAFAQEGVVTVTWEPPSGAWDRFVVYRSVTPGSLGEPVANLTATQFVDERVERGRTYLYQVASLNSAGLSPPSEPAVVALVRTPGSPTSVMAIGAEGEIRLTWRPPTDTGDAPLETLRYYVSRQSPGSAARIVATDLTALAYVDRQVQPGIDYTYTVTTLNPQVSAASAPVSAAAKAIVNQAPVAHVDIVPPVADVDAPVELDAGRSEDPDGRIVLYVFDFGDGTDPIQTQSSSVTHTYERNGTFQVKVIVTDDRGQDGFTTASVVVGEIVGEGNAGGDLPGGATTMRPGGNPSDRPGSSTPGIPGPGVALVVGALAGLALALRRRRA